MRLLAPLTVALLSVYICACGGSSKGTNSTSRASSQAAATHTAPATSASKPVSAAEYSKADSDKDNDIGAPYDDKRHPGVLNYGHAASAADERRAAVFLKRYYAVAAAGDGAKACAMIVSSLAKAVVEDYGHGSAGSAYLSSGTTCPAVMALLFKHFHNQLIAEYPKLKVTHVRLAGNNGLAVMSFGTMPEREISVIREGRTWKVQTLLDNELP